MISSLAAGFGLASSIPYAQTAQLNINGPGAQTVTLNAGALPNTTFNNHALNVTPAANVFFGSLTLTDGVYNGGSVTTILYNGSGADASSSFTATASTFSGGTGTIQFCDGPDGITAGIAISADGVTFNNVNFYSGGSHINSLATNSVISVAGTLTLTGGLINGGTINAKGTILVGTSFNNSGTTLFNIAGAAVQLSGAGANAVFPTSQTTISAGATLQLLTASNISKLTINSNGTLDLNGQGFTSATFINSGFIKMTGAESCSTPTLNPGSTVTYIGSSSAVTVKSAWTYKNLVLNAPGKTIQFTSGATYNIGALTAASAVGNPMTISSTSGGNFATISQATGSVSVTLWEQTPRLQSILLR